MQMMHELQAFLNVFYNPPCRTLKYEVVGDFYKSPYDPKSTIGSIAWNYLACAEMILEPIAAEGQGFVVPDADQLVDLEN